MPRPFMHSGPSYHYLLRMEAEKGTAWSLEFGAWSLELGVWSLEFGAWSLELGAWRLEFGVWMEFAMLWGRGGGRGPWAGSRTGQPQRSTGSKGQLTSTLGCSPMSQLCLARKSSLYFKTRGPGNRSSDGREDRTKLPIVRHRARFRQGSMPV